MDSYTYEYDEEIKPISKIEFSVLGNKEVKGMSALGKDSIGINYPELYDNMEPKQGGLIDLRLGTTDHSNDCKTCGLDSEHCVGHFGHIDLAEDVFHIGYLPFLKKILSCICLRCSRLLINKSNEKEMMEMLKHKSGKARMAEVRNLVKTVTVCDKKDYGCGAPVSKIRSDAKKSTVEINIISETTITNVIDEKGQPKGTQKIRQILKAEDCYNILKNISDMDCRIMGIDPTKTRPEDLILRKFPIPPVAVRPSAKADKASSTREDSLTLKLSDIVKSNKRIKQTKESPGQNSMRYLPEHVQLLQYNVATYFDNDTLTLPKTEHRGKNIKSLTARLKGKQGRIRGNLMGKRVDFSARTVITPDATIAINELRLPIKLATRLTFPETVTPYNIDRLQELVRNGTKRYPGADKVKPMSNKSRGAIDLRYRKEKVDLRFGDIVERHLQDGDYVLLNRQPTLHKLSMMGHRVKVVQDDKLNTFGLNVNVTTPYNADFDGDEMNIFVPQSLQTHVELKMIADVKRQIISPRTSDPIIGGVQDSIIGSYLLTDSATRVSWQDAMNLIANVDIDDPTKIVKNKEYTGYELFSMIVPDNINMSGAIDIVKGNLEKGQISKKTIGSGATNGLIHQVWDEYGVDETAKLIGNIQDLANNYIIHSGFTVGLGDIEIPEEVEEQIENLIENKRIMVKCKITEMENNPEMYDPKAFEGYIKSMLDAILGDVSKLVMDNLDKNNNFNRQIRSGTKGKDSNMGQMAGCIGQTSVENERPRKKINHRALPYMYQNDDSALGRGFSKSPFIKGADPREFVSHNKGAREGLIDTAIKSVTGDTPIVVMDGNTPKRVLIGDWIDQLIKTSAEGTVQRYEEKDMEYLPITNELSIPTTDSEGNVTWGKITAVTRHDPTDYLYKIETKSGRKVIVADSKSLLIWNNEIEEFEQVNSPDVKVGDFVPVTNYLPEDVYHFESFWDTRKDGFQQALRIVYNKSYDDLINYINYNEKFISGLVDGLFSTEKQWLAYYDRINFPVDSKYVDVVVMLLNRLGVNPDIVPDGLSIPYTQVDGLPNFTNPALQKQRDWIVGSFDTTTVADVMLDPITNIEKITPEAYPKLYDLTVPSTLNFGLANGLHVVDTAESGYIQRKLVKALEDISVAYDNTVRNGNNTIVQFMYGDDGVDPTKQYRHTLDIIKMGNSEVKDRFDFGDSDYLSSLLELRNTVRQSKIRTEVGYTTFGDSYYLPVNISLIINNVKSTDLSGDKLTSAHVLKKLDEILEYEQTKIVSMSKEDAKDKNSIKYQDEMVAKTVMRLALHQFLGPNPAIKQLKLNKAKFDKICERIVENFNRSIIEPGEMVGTVAAQSIGEPTTQMSCVRDTKIVVDDDGRGFNGTIGEFIDNLMIERVNEVWDLGDNSTALPLRPSDNFQILGVTDSEQMEWNRILEVSRHPARGGLVKITTRSGRTTTATKSHSFLKRGETTVEPVLGSNLRVGHRVPVSRKIPLVSNPTLAIKVNGKNIDMDGLLGWLTGAVLANFPNGELKTYDEELINIVLDRFGDKFDEWIEMAIGEDANKINPCILTANVEFIKAFVRAYIDEVGETSNGKITVPASDSIKDDLILMLGYFDIWVKRTPTGFQIDNSNSHKYIDLIGSATLEVDIIPELEVDMDDCIPNLGKTIYKIADKLRLRGYSHYIYMDVTRSRLETIIERFEASGNQTDYTIGLMDNLYQALDADVMWDEITHIEYLDDPQDYVYDFTVPGNDSFLVDCGIIVHNTLNTFHSAGIGAMGTASLGVPRMKELMSFSKNLKTPMTTVYVQKEFRKELATVNRIQSFIKHTTLSELRDRVDVYFDPDPRAKDGFMENDNVSRVFKVQSQSKTGCRDSINGLPWLIRVVMNREKMVDKDITLLDVKASFCNNWERRYKDTKGLKKEERVILEQVTQCAILTNNENDPQPIIHIRLDMSSFDLQTITTFLDMFVDNFQLKGIVGINRILGVDDVMLMSDENEDLKPETDSEWVITADGVNLLDIRYINGIDLNRTTTNDVVEIYETFGIEAARTALIKELKTVFASHKINFQHISILADVMTNHGVLISVDRHGLDRRETDPLGRISFEKMVDQFLQAAVYCEEDNMNSVSARIMAGQVIKGGTGAFEIALDTDLLEKAEYIEEDVQYKKTFDQLTTSNVIDDVIQKDEEMFIPL
jgi:DNA-directed RNA polymerase beta' subunit